MLLGDRSSTCFTRTDLLAVLFTPPPQNTLADLRIGFALFTTVPSWQLLVGNSIPGNFQGSLAVVLGS